jgi:hypothetical protein
MANVPISGLNPGAAVGPNDLFPDVQTVGVGPVKVTAAQIKTFTSNSPTLVTPNIGVATGSSLALGGAAIGSNVLAVNGGSNFSDVVAATVAVGGASIGANVFAAFGPVQITGNFSQAGGSFVIGSQQISQGSLTLANTAAGSFETTIQSSNLSTASVTYTLPPSDGTNGYVLSTDGSGVLSWVDSLTIVEGTTPTSGFSAGQILISDGSVVKAAGNAISTSLALNGATIGLNKFAVTGTSLFSGNIVQDSGNLRLGNQQVTQGKIILENTASGSYQTSIQSSNSAIEAWDLTLPISKGTNGYALLTDGTGSSAWGQVNLTTGVAGVLPVSNGGTGNSTNTIYGVLLGNGSNAINATSSGSNGQILQSKGASANPNWTTATFPDTATSTGAILRADGTNWVATTATYPTTTTINQILYSSANNTLTGLTTGNGGVVNTSSAGVPSITANPTLGVQQTTQGSLILANTAAGAFSTTIQASNSASAAWTLTLPTTAGTNNYVLTTNGSGVSSWAQVSLTAGVTGTLPVANGGTGITSFGTGVATALGNNINSAGGFVTFGAALGAVTATTVAIGGATIGSNALAVTGTSAFGGNVTLTSASLSTSGNISSTAWTTSGAKLKIGSVTLTDTSSSGTVAAAYTNLIAGDTLVASNPTTYTNYYSTFIGQPTASTNVTLTNRWAIGIDGNTLLTAGSIIAYPAGSAAAPPITNSSDRTTGWFFPSSGNLAASTGGSERFRIDTSGSFGVGITPTAATVMRFGRAITGGAFSNCITFENTINSDVTNARAFMSLLTTQAAAFTCTNILNFYVNPQAFGNGSIVTNQFAFHAESTITSATINYGFYGNIAATPSGGTSASTASTMAQSSTTVTIVTTGAHGYSTGQIVTVAATANATALTTGATCTILTVGTTDFTLIGAASNTVGLSFTATGPGTGTGTVTMNSQGSGKQITVVDPTTFTYTATSATFGAITLLTGPVTVSRRYNLFMNGTADNYLAGRIGIGALPTTFGTVFVARQLTGQTTNNCIDIGATVASDVTSSARGVQSQLTTSAAAFTVTNLVHFYANPSARGAGSTITNHYGFIAESSISTGTNNFGFYSNIASASNSWNFFANGTANNAFAGSSRFGSTTAPANTVDITGSFGRGAPVTKVADFSLGTAENWVINNKAGSTCTVTLPAASSWTGREVMIMNYQAQTVVSASSNVVPSGGGAAGTAILAATAGKCATLVSDGTNWIIMANN